MEGTIQLTCYEIREHFVSDMLHTYFCVQILKGLVFEIECSKRQFNSVNEHVSMNSIVLAVENGMLWCLTM